MATGTDGKVILKTLGLYTYPNQLAAPDGAMSVAIDVFVDKPGIIQNRPDHTPTTYTAVGFSALNRPTQPSGYSPIYIDALNASVSFDANGVAAYAKSYSFVHQFPVTSSTTLINTGFGGFLTSAFTASGNDYFQSGGEPIGVLAYTSGKTFRWNSSSATGRNVGMPQAPTPADYSGNPTFGGGGATAPKYGLPLTGQPAFGVAASTPLSSATGGGTAYRTLFLTKDTQNNLVRGPPSGRLVLASSVAYTYGLVQPLISGVAAGDIWQVYRSEVQTDSTVQPSDDCRLVYEYIIQAADVTKKYVTLPGDVAPDALRGPSLYTNDTQQGALQAERYPPDCQFATAHKDAVFYGGVTSKGVSAIVTVLGLAGWVVGTSSFTFNGNTYTSVTAGTGENWPNRQFAIYTTGSPSIDTANTLRSLCRCLSYDKPTYSFSYVSSASSTSFQMLITQAAQGGALSGAALTYSGIPANTISPAGSISLASYGKSNWLYFSKSQQPEAVPDVNYVPVGADSVPIRGLASLRDSLFVFKEDGTYRVTGTNSSNIRVELFDATVRMYAGQDKSIAIAGNQVFAATSQGIVSVTESGISVIDLAIKNITSEFTTVPRYFSDTNADGNLPLYPCVGGASDVAHKYFIVFSNAYTTVATAQVCYAYNFIENAWTQMTMPGTLGLNTGVGGVTVILDRSDQLLCATGNSKVITSMPTGAWISDAVGGPGTFSFAYSSTGDYPGQLMRYFDVSVSLAGSNSVTSLTFTFSSDSGAAPVAITQTVPTQILGAQSTVKVGVPQAHSYCSNLNFTISGPGTTCRFTASAVAIGFSKVSDRIPSGGRS